MPKYIRRIFFWILVAVFFVGGTGAVLYSQGWRIDFTNGGLGKVGALYLRTYPQDTQLMLDSEPLANKSWWIIREGTFVGSLFPKNYSLTVSRDGYLPWSGTLPVAPALVTERKEIVLVPDETKRVVVSDEAQSVIALTDTVTPAVIQSNGLVRVGTSTLTGTYLLDRGGLIVTETDRGVRIYPEDSPSWSLALGSTDKVQLTDDGLIITNPSEVVTYNKTGSRRSVLFSAQKEETLFMALRSNDNDVWVTKSTSTYALTVTPRGFRGSSRIYPLPAASIELLVAGDSIGVLDALGSLWWVDPDTDELVEVAHRVGLASFSPQGDAVAVLVDNLIEIIPLDKERLYGRITLRESDRISGFAWYRDGAHLFVQYPDRLLFTDTFDKAEESAHTFSDIKGYVFDAENYLLYLTSIDNTITSLLFPEQ